MLVYLMKSKFPDLTIRHRRIEDPDSYSWNLTPLVYKGGTKIIIQKSSLSAQKKLELLPFKQNQIDIIRIIKGHAEASLDSGISVKTVLGQTVHLKGLFGYIDDKAIRFDNVDNIRQALYEYSEYQFTRANLKKIKHKSAYSSLSSLSLALNGAFENLKFKIVQTRLKNKNQSQRATNRESEKVMFSDASQFANFCFDITKNFDPVSLTSGSLPIVIKVNNQSVNLTGARKHPIEVDKSFIRTEAYLGFNSRVSAEVMIFLAMTIQNQAPTYNLKRAAFDYKVLGEKYEVREYKAKRGGEVLFKIPKPYKPYFEKYLSFLNEYASDSEWLFPHLEKYKGFRKRTNQETGKLKGLCSRYEIPWVKPSSFRKIGENILMRMANDEKTASDYANHAVATFRQRYEFPSLQRAMVEVARFWDKNDPLTHGEQKISLFDSSCNGIPTPIDDATNQLPKPDCITPTGCIGCKHYRDEESFDYVWGLHSFKFLKIIESSSHLTNEEKPSNIAIDWANLKINWFKNSEKIEHQQWVEEASMRIEEGDYHSTWSRKIEKYEG
ncbi:MAG: hypothetical protein ACI88H_000492 [Cocleimonas sp.]|jgi:hypothetical protein